MTNPKKLGRYEIVQEIGRGTLFVVYHAVDPTSPGRPLVLQVLLPHLLVDQDFVKRLEHEVDKAAILRHPNITAIYGVGEIEGRPFVAREFVDGQSLDQVLAAEGPLPLERALAIVEPIAAALDHAHSQVLVHLDVKPSNILVGSTGRVVLTGFGLARAIEGVALIGPGPGTPAYMSPEQAAVEGPAPDWRADLYALGVVAYEMLTGRVPFQAGFRSAVLHQHVHELPPSPRAVNPALPPAVEPVLLKALAKRPGDRYQSGADLVAALRGTPTAGAVVDVAVAEKPRPVAEEARPAPASAAAKFPDLLPQPKPRPARDAVSISLGAVVGLIVLIVICCLGAMVYLGPSIGEEPVQPAPVSRRVPTSTPSPTPRTVPTRQPTPPPQPTPTSYQGDLPLSIIARDRKEMVLVPGGRFLMGSLGADSPADEKPMHTVFLEAYYIDRTEVTNAQFCRFLNEKGNQEEGGVPWLDVDGLGEIVYNDGRYQPLENYEDYPVVNVTWYGARAYAEWAGKRLPTEAEWEKAARGVDGRVYPWGNVWDPAWANTKAGPAHRSTPANRFPDGSSPYGVLNMAGNVWEWCADWYDNRYYARSPDRNPAGPQLDGESSRVLRGGSWRLAPALARCAARGQLVPDYASDHIGFRCVLPISPWADELAS